MILLRIQDLEQGRCRITLKRATDFIDFIQHNDGVGCLDLLQRLHQFTRHSAHVGATVAFNLSLIAHAP